MIVNKQITRAAFALTVVILSVVLGFSSYSIVTGQVSSLWESGTQLDDISHDNTFRLRYAVALPAYLIGQQLNSLELGHTLYGAFFLAINVLLWLRLEHYLYRGRARYLDICFAAFLAVQLYIVNGRGILIWTSALVSILLDVLLSHARESGYRINALAFIFSVCTSLLLSSLSTGAFLVSLLYNILLVKMYLAVHRSRFANLLVVVASIGIAPYVTQLAIQYADKNISYFEGSFVSLLGHGALSVIAITSFDPLELILAAMVVLGLALLLTQAVASKSILEFKRSLLIYSFGILFGFTTGSPLIIVLLLVASRQSSV